MNVLRKSMMFILSFFPLYIIFALMNIDIFKRVCINDAVLTDYIFTIILFLFIIISSITLWIFVHVMPTNFFKYEKVQTSKDAVTSYLFTYIIPFISIDICKQETIMANFILFFTIWVLYIRLNLFYLNPVLAAIGYIPYEVGNKIIITNIPFCYLTRRHELKGSFFTPDIFIAKANQNNR